MYIHLKQIFIEYLDFMSLFKNPCVELIQSRIKKVIAKNKKIKKEKNLRSIFELCQYLLCMSFYLNFLKKANNYNFLKKFLIIITYTCLITFISLKIQRGKTLH